MHQDSWQEGKVVVTGRFARALIIVLAIGLVFTPTVIAQTLTATPEESSWHFSDVEVTPEDPEAGSVASVQFMIEDQDGEPVSGLRPSGLLREPSTADDESAPSPTLTTIGREMSDPGQYQVNVALNQPGRWWIEIRVENDAGRVTRYDHFTVVGENEDPAPATTAEPLFLRGTDWDAYYRVDPQTGSVATLEGDELFEVGDRWWLADVRMDSKGGVSREYGGTWKLQVDLVDAISGSEVASIDLGDIRANVFNGSREDPAIASSVTVSDDGTSVYVYWARQLGEGWVARIAKVDPSTGEVQQQRILNGAVSSNGFWAELYPVEDGRLIVAEQVVEGATVSGYRLSLLDQDTLATLDQYRRTEATDDPLTHCMLAYPGPIGSVTEMSPGRYSLCSPPQMEDDRALLVWDPTTGEPVHTIELSSILGSDPEYADGVASPDQSTFYAVNTRSVRIAEIDMATGDVLRERSLLPDDESDDPSTLDRIFDWVFGAWVQPVSAATRVEPSVTISPDGETLYIVANPEGREPGVLVVDLDNLEIVNSLMTGEVIDGLVATGDRRIAVIERGDGANGDTVTVLDDEGGTYLSFLLPGRSDVVGSRR